MAFIPFAPEVQAAVDALRASWTDDDHFAHRSIEGDQPESFASTVAIESHRLRRQFEDAPRPEWLKPFKLIVEAEPPKQNPRPRKVSPPTAGPVKPIGEMLAEIIARLTGQQGGAV